MIDLKRIAAALVTAVSLFTIFPAGTDSRAADLIKKKFDLGGKGAASGYIGVSASDAYDLKKGYGFNSTAYTENTDGPGSGALSDAVRFKGSNGHFKVDLPKGVYKITVSTGKVDSATITAEGVYQLFFLQGTDAFTIPVTDGQLNIHTTSGTGSVFSISAIEIELVSTDTTTKPTIWLAGDSTVVDYRDDSLPQRGWGSYLSKYIDTDKYYVRNISVESLTTADFKNFAFPTAQKYGKSGDILILAHGIEDYARGNNAADYTKNITDMIRSAKASGMKVYLVKQHGDNSDPYKYPLPTEKWYSKEIDSIAKNEGAGIIDIFSPWLEMQVINIYYDQAEYYGKGIIPNEAGADKMAQIVSSALFPMASKTAAPTPTEVPTVIYQTEASGQAISNPHKGFVMTAYNPDMIRSTNGYIYGIGGSAGNSAWDVCTIVSGSPKWNELNPEEGVYNWDSIDRMLEVCEEYSLTYGIRIMPYSSYLGEDYVPQWVYNKGAKKNTAQLRDDPNKQVVFPKWDDPVYIQAHKDFTRALAEKYDGDPRVEFIDVRPFGDYGEWHNSFAIGEFMPSLEIQKDMLNFYDSVFNKTLLVLPSNARGEIYKYALSLGITKRDDGLISLGNSEWSLVPTYRANMPVIGENYWPYSWMRDTVRGDEYSLVNWTTARFRETIEISHLSIFALDQDSNCSYGFYNEQKAIIDEMCNRLGYNFTVTSATRYDNRLIVRIKNTGLASCFFNIDLRAELTDENGNKISDYDAPIRIEKASFRDGEERTFVFDYNGEIPSDATICLSMYDIDNPLVAGKDPTVRFENKNNLPNNKLKLITVWTNPGTEPNGATPTAAPGVNYLTEPEAEPTAKPTGSADPKVSASTQKAKSQILEFVERIYVYVLDRKPEEEGAAFWSDELYSFRRTGAEVGLQFIFSDEFIARNTTDSEFVTILYRTFFGREPEKEGFDFWTDALKNGTLDRMGVALGFVYSQEWADTCASYGIRSGGDLTPSTVIEPTELTYAFVERMYTTAMKRGSDKEGKNYWANELSNFKCTGEYVGLAFFLSDEMNGSGLSDKEFITRLYKTFMDREPDKDGFKYWCDTLASGVQRSDVVFGFTRSPEFVDKCIEARILPY